jgi:hypothetical protein
MSVEVQWNDTDPATGEKRFVSVDRFAGVWRFRVRARRREDWRTPTVISRDMWETLLEALERRYRRREGVSDADLVYVRKELAKLPPDPESDAGSDGAPDTSDLGELGQER